MLLAFPPATSHPAQRPTPVTLPAIYKEQQHLLLQQGELLVEACNLAVRSGGGQSMHGSRKSKRALCNTIVFSQNLVDNI
jgi:hypothetical protein